MKAVILAAGQGTRLRPVTLTMPKPLVPVANKPLIAYAIDVLKAAGMSEIGIVVHDMESPIVTGLGDGASMGVKLDYILQREQLGLAHAIGLCRDFVGDGTFAVFLGDNIFQDQMEDLLRGFTESDADAVIGLSEVPDPQRFGIARIENGKLTEVLEKPKKPPSNLAIAGVYLFRRNIFDAIDKIKPSHRNEYEITDAIQVLINEGKAVSPYTIQGWWIDAGKPDSIIRANQLVLGELPYTPAPENGERIVDSDVSSRVLIGEGSKIVNSVVRGPVIIGDNVTITNSYIGPYTSLGNGVEVNNSEIEASIIMQNSKVSNIAGRIDSSLLADNSEVFSSQNVPAAHRFILAENSYVRL